MSHEMQDMSYELGTLSDEQQREIAKRLSPLFSHINLEIPAQRAIAFDVKNTVTPITHDTEAMK